MINRQDIEQTLCPVCEKALTVNIFPEFLYCEECGIGVKRVECRQNQSQARAVYNSAWVNKHCNDLSAELKARSIVKYIKRFNGVEAILDVGCGSGWLVGLLAGEGYDSTGLDFSEKTITFARLNKRGKYLCATVDEVKRKYDLVIMSHILEHIPDPVGYLRKVSHLLGPLGLLLVAVPNLDAYDVTSLWRREHYATLFDRTHNMAFSGEGLVLLLEKAGYEIYRKNTQTLGATSLNGLAVGLYRKLRGSPTIYKKQEGASTAVPDKVHSAYKPIIESRLVRCLCYIPNRLSERGGRGKDLVILAVKQGNGGKK